MSMLIKSASEFPFSWGDLTDLRNSDAYRREIYLLDSDKPIVDIILMFYELFGLRKEKLQIFNQDWWNFSLETWIDNDVFDYDPSDKSEETASYLRMLLDSNIEIGYSGCCICNDWDKYLKTMLACLFACQAPYSPLFCDVENQYFFYFHHTGSIGIYFKEKNTIVKQILKKAYTEYELVEN